MFHCFCILSQKYYMFPRNSAIIAKHLCSLAKVLRSPKKHNSFAREHKCYYFHMIFTLIQQFILVLDSDWLEPFASLRSISHREGHGGRANTNHFTNTTVVISKCSFKSFLGGNVVIYTSNMRFILRKLVILISTSVKVALHH